MQQHKFCIAQFRIVENRLQQQRVAACRYVVITHAGEIMNVDRQVKRAGFRVLCNKKR